MRCQKCGQSSEGLAEQMWHQEGWCQKNSSAEDRQKAQARLELLRAGVRMGVVKPQTTTPAQGRQQKGGKR